ncbi:MAG: EAL domain-containing protein [Actinobacteria bacterium]|nr:EAL domain-containing protein [Actinomycetota bacterium]
MQWDDISSLDAQFRLLVDLSREVVFRVDEFGDFEWVSPAVERITGWPPEDLVGRSSLDVVPPAGLDDLAKIEHDLRNGDVVHYLGQFAHADGTARWTEVELRPAYDDVGERMGTVGVARDVHDAVIAQRALAESEAHYRLIADHASDVVVKLDPQLRIRWVSPSVQHVLGWDPDEAEGIDALSLVHPDDVALTDHRGMTDGDPARPPVPPDGFVLRILDAHGKYRWMLSTRPRTVFGPDGEEIATVSNWTDVQDLVKARQAAQRDQERLRVTLDSMLDPHVVLAPLFGDDGTLVDFVVVEANVAALVASAARRDEAITGRMVEFLSGRDHLRAVDLLGRVFETGESLAIDDQPFDSRADGMREHRYDLRAVKVNDQVSVTWRDVTDRHVFEERLSDMALHDPLTGLANRAALLDELLRALVSGRRSRAMTAVLMMDLDQFKSVNDTHGHGVGDQLLVVAADRLRRVVRAGDLVARLGGDEFVVVMRDLADTDEPFRVGARIVDEFRQPIRVSGHDLLTTASLGIAISTDRSGADDLLREADVAMYRAKESGRDRFTAYNEALRVAAGERVLLEQQLRPALGLGELVVFFQPEVDLATGEVCGAEALLRWHHQSGELYAADRFIDLAEETGLMVDIGRWVLREGCRAAAKWSKCASTPLRTLYLNVSRAQLSDVGLSDDLERILAETGVSPAMICVEVAEPALDHAGMTVTANLARLHELGVRLAIDDFGSGDAALAHLRDHRVDAVKIDRSFVSDVDVDDYSRRLVAGITALAGQVGLTVVAEGVETDSQARVLRDLGCATAHGYLFAHAVPLDEFPTVMRRLHHIG